MSDTIDKNARYRDSHEWARLVSGKVYEIGITDHAQSSLGDIVFVDLPATGKSFRAGESFGVVESVKAASDLYIPLGGKVTEVNTELKANPGLVNQDPFHGGWIVRIEASDPAEWAALLDAEAYAKLLGSI